LRTVEVAVPAAPGTAWHQNLLPRRKKVPVTFQGNYDTLVEAAGKSKDEPIYIKASCLNEKCASTDPLRLKPWFVDRNAVLLSPTGDAIYEKKPVPLSVCEKCKRRFRVLPVEFLPYKTFSLPVIEKTCHLYCISGHGLRKTVEQIPGVSPHYSTLHGWLGGIGERASDKIKIKTDKAITGEPSLPPTAALVAETSKKQDLDLIDRWNKTDPPIAFWKYKTLIRKEGLKSCLRLLLIAISLFQDSCSPLTMWEAFLIPSFNVPCWLFPSRALVTPIQLTDDIENMIICNSDKTSKRGPP